MRLQPAEAPGRADPGAAAPKTGGDAPASATRTGEGATEPRPSDTGGSPGGFGGLAMLVPFVILFGFIFMMSRSEKKKRGELESKLKKGDRVVTRSGIAGKLTEVSGDRVRVEIAPGVNVQMVKSAIEGLDPGDTGGKAVAPASSKAPSKDAQDAKDSKKKK